MRTVGIICEYNPFHTGHKRQIDILRSMGYDCIVCVMSGNYTQRGELAIFDKYTRAEGALLCGADVVLELPFPYSSLSAEGFAEGGVHILASLGVDAISFGSECGDLNVLDHITNSLLSEEFAQIYSDLQKGGLGSASAYFEALKRVSGADQELLSNDILAISYIASIKRNKADIKALPIKREGAAYNEEKLSGGVLPSASAIRRSMTISTGSFTDLFCNYIPEGALGVFKNAIDEKLAPVYAESIGKEILSFFKLLTPSEITSRAILRSGGGIHIAEDGCGILERICNVASTSKSYGEFLRSCYTSKYTNARINRVILFSLAGVTQHIAQAHPEYTALLAANATGREFLASARKKAQIKIVTKPADAPKHSHQKTVCDAADSLYSSAIPKNVSDDFFIKSRPFILK